MKEGEIPDMADQGKKKPKRCNGFGINWGSDFGDVRTRETKNQGKETKRRERSAIPKRTRTKY